MIEDFFNNPVASDQANILAKEMCAVMREKRKSLISAAGKPMSIRALCAKNQMDYSILSRAENPDLDTVPALSFWLDWTESLNVELGDIVKEARERLSKKN